MSDVAPYARRSCGRDHRLQFLSDGPCCGRAREPPLVCGSLDRGTVRLDRQGSLEAGASWETRLSTRPTQPPPRWRLPSPTLLQPGAAYPRRVCTASEGRVLRDLKLRWH